MKFKARLLAAGFVALFAAVEVASLAMAAGNANAYLVINNWRCVGGGKVIQVSGSVDTLWTRGDAGDNIIYPRVQTYRWNTFNGRALCSRPWYQGGSYWINVIDFQFYPKQNGQTFWW